MSPARQTGQRADADRGGLQCEAPEDVVIIRYVTYGELLQSGRSPDIALWAEERCASCRNGRLYVKRSKEANIPGRTKTREVCSHCDRPWAGIPLVAVQRGINRSNWKRIHVSSGSGGSRRIGGAEDHLVALTEQFSEVRRLVEAVPTSMRPKRWESCVLAWIGRIDGRLFSHRAIADYLAAERPGHGPWTAASVEERIAAAREVGRRRGERAGLLRRSGRGA